MSGTECWYRQVAGAYWIVYQGRQAIWEAVTEGELLAWLRERGIAAAHVPLRIARTGSRFRGANS